jgi:hypothetical protein
MILLLMLSYSLVQSQPTGENMQQGLKENKNLEKVEQQE